MRYSIFSSTPDITDLNFVVRVATGELEQLLDQAHRWGYDGIEFLPDPKKVPDSTAVLKAMNDTGGSVLVVNSGRFGAQNLTLLNKDSAIRHTALECFKDIVSLAADINARVGLGMARGFPDPDWTPGQTEGLAYETFSAIAEHAEKVGAVVMLEPADPGATSFIHTVGEAVAWVERIGKSSFTVMLDTYQLATVEESIEAGILASYGRANHIHLYDPSRWPPGVLPQSERLDWKMISQALRNQGFDGSGSVVLAPEGDPADTAPKAVTFLRNLFA